MCKKVIISVVSVVTLIVSFSYIVYASDITTLIGEPIVAEDSTSASEDSLEQAELTKVELADEIIDIPSIDVQLENLYNTIGEELDLDTKYIKIVYSLYDSQAAYASMTPNIENDEMVTSIGFKEIVDYIKAPWIDSEIERDCSKFLPDILYTDCYNIKNLIDDKLDNNRSNRYDALKQEVKIQIAVYEAIIQYINGEYIDFHPIYENLIALKNSNENLVEVSDTGFLDVKEDFENVLINNGIDNPKIIDAIALLFAYDNYLVETNEISELQEYNVQPFNNNENTHENMILAASSIVGKCRYVWGGGHDGSSYIDGINPAWKLWNETYQGNNGCIRPAGTYCPIHGNSDEECSYSGTIYSAEDYLDSRKDIMDVSEIDTNEYSELLKNIDVSRGLSAHRLDGLDCSGFVSWVYNQITDNKHYNAVAKDYVNEMGLKSLPMNSKLEPGDVFAWSTHIIMIVAPYNEKQNVYLTVESVPDVVGFGVAYYSSASSSDIEDVKKLAEELNLLIGGLDDSQARVRTYCMNTKGTYKVTEEITVTSDNGEESVIDEVVRYEKFSILGRYPGEFKEVYIEEYGKNFRELYAVEMMQYIVDNLPYDYLSGYNKYINNEERFIKSDNIRMWE